MMSASIVPTRALALANGHAIFLDCAADRYFALSPNENDALLRLLAGSRISAREQRALLGATGVEATTTNFRALLAVRETEAPLRASIASSAPGLAARLSAIRHLFGAKIRLGMTGFHATLESLARIRRLSPSLELEAGHGASRIAGAHDWLSRHFTANDACLLRSLALAYHLRSSGCAAQLVIAVRTDPFAAHCWVESGDRVLNEELDAVASFEPILFVR